MVKSETSILPVFHTSILALTLYSCKIYLSLLLNIRRSMKKCYFPVFIFLILVSISCRQKRTGVPRVLIYTNTTTGPEAATIIQSIRHLGEINGFSINVTDTGTLFRDD